MKRAAVDAKKNRIALNAYIKLMRCTETVNKRIEKQEPLRGTLTVSQFAVLEALYFHGPMKQVEIAKKILKTPGNLTMVIDNLVKADLVTRRVSDRDRRSNSIELTDKGNNLIVKVFPRMADAIEHTFSVLTEKELAEFSKLLKKLGTSEFIKRKVGFQT
ncbi:MAG: MarR family winged helix-turn-helix transcriptional regulator [Spirochaetales bacterium]|jgi:MarR family 2-MHQ and catechol resistance regulon transcriptional repressor|nr:MarR family winged helix-turn-helix transcriptional regulator [Spirochaetales bacterium]